MQVSKFRETPKKHMENTKNTAKKTRYFATLWRGLHRENKKPWDNKKNKTIQKIQNYRPHGTPCHKSPDMRCIVLDETEAQ